MFCYVSNKDYKITFDLLWIKMNLCRGWDYIKASVMNVVPRKCVEKDLARMSTVEEGITNR